jgi:hypothetical protein
MLLQNLLLRQQLDSFQETRTSKTKIASFLLQTLIVSRGFISLLSAMAMGRTATMCQIT